MEGFRLQALLGMGQTATVVLASPAEGEETLTALKIFTPTICQSIRGRRRVAEEARALAAIQSPHVANYRRLIRRGTRLILEIEPVLGLDASQLRRLHGRGLPLRIATQLLSGVAGALAAAHEQGIVHHDVLPANIVLSLTGRVALVDFGRAMHLARLPIARRIRDHESPHHPPPGSVGLPGYDVYMLGRTMMDLLGSLLRIPATTPEAHDREIAMSVEHLGLPEGLSRLLRDMLQARASYRPPAADVQGALMAFSELLPGPDLSEWAARHETAFQAQLGTYPASSLPVLIGPPERTPPTLDRLMGKDWTRSLGAIDYWLSEGADPSPLLAVIERAVRPRPWRREARVQEVATAFHLLENHGNPTLQSYARALAGHENRAVRRAALTFLVRQGIALPVRGTA